MSRNFYDKEERPITFIRDGYEFLLLLHALFLFLTIKYLEAFRPKEASLPRRNNKDSFYVLITCAVRRSVIALTQVPTYFV